MLLHLGVLNEQDNYPLQMMLSYDYLARAHLRGVYCPFFLAQAAMHILKCNKQINATRQKATRGADLGGFQTSHFSNITFRLRPIFSWFPPLGPFLIANSCITHCCVISLYFYRFTYIRTPKSRPVLSGPPPVPPFHNHPGSQPLPSPKIYSQSKLFSFFFYA